VLPKTKVVDNTKSCSKCKKYKTFVEFPPDKRASTKLAASCRECYRKLYIERSREGYQPPIRNKNLKKAYSLRKYWVGSSNEQAQENYNKMFESQQGKCKICRKHQSELPRALCVDHCHETSIVRGLLCDHCNRGIGHFKDDIHLLDSAKEYLKGIS
jgi:hypothetical protein